MSLILSAHFLSLLCPRKNDTKPNNNDNTI